MIKIYLSRSKEKIMQRTGERTIPSQFNRYEFERIYKLVSDTYGDPQKVVLDYGCGSGYGTDILANAFGQVTGIDVDKKAIEFCCTVWRRSNLEFYTFDPTTCPFPDESFDCVFSFQVFEHIPLELVELYVQSVWRMLKRGGVAVITTPNSNNYRGGFSGNPFHIKEYTVEELETIFGAFIPRERFSLLATEDVLSTRVRLRILKLLPTRSYLRKLAYLVELSLKTLERVGMLSTDYRKMLKRDNVADVLGSLVVVLEKS